MITAQSECDKDLGGAATVKHVGLIDNLRGRGMVLACCRSLIATLGTTIKGKIARYRAEEILQMPPSLDWVEP